MITAAEAASSLRIRPIAPTDDSAVRDIILTVMPEFGARGPGFAIEDAEVHAMSTSYARDRCAYFVVEAEARVVGGGGIAPLEGGPASVCELRKMYFLPQWRGRGVGRLLLNRCLETARAQGFAQCYLETLNQMTAARALYERHGFQLLSQPLGSTGHYGCNRFYLLDLGS